MKEFVHTQSTFFYCIAICLIAIVAYWNIASCQFTMKYDIIDANFPNQVYQSQLEQNGEIPLWDMYSYLGNAMHSKVLIYYPVRFLSSKISEYTLCKLNLEFVLHIMLAGIGMFFLLLRFSFAKHIAFVIGVAYMLSGFFSGNAQHFWWVASGAFLPFVILTYYSLMHEPSFKNSMYFLLVIVCFVLGGYPAFTIVVAYGIGIYFLLKIIQYGKHKQFAKIRSIIVQHGIIVCISILLLLPVIVSYTDMVQAITRGNGVTLVQALWDSLHFKHCVTFVFPLLTAFTQNNYWHIDPSMMNMYIGIIPLLFALLSLRFITKPPILLLWIVVLFFMALSIGTELPIREFFYNYIPLFNTFRFPALFRLFFMFGLVLLAAYSFAQHIQKITLQHLHISLVIIGVLGFLMAVTFLLYPIVTHELPLNYWHLFISKLSKKNILGIHGLWFFVISASTFFYIKILANKHISVSKIAPWCIVFFTVFDMIVSVLLLSPQTIHNHIDLRRVQKKIEQLPKNTAITNIHERAYSQYSKELALPLPLWRNNQLLHKKRTFNAYTSFVYNATEKFETSLIFDSVKTYPLLYFPQYIYTDKDSIFDFSKKIVVFHTQGLHNPQQNSNESNIELLTSTSNSVTCRVYSNQQSYIVFMQNMYPGWKAYVNSNETEIILANYCCMAIQVPQGTCEITFEYAPHKAIIAYYVYEWTLYILIGLCLYFALRTYKVKFIKHQ